MRLLSRSFSVMPEIWSSLSLQIHTRPDDIIPRFAVIDFVGKLQLVVNFDSLACTQAACPVLFSTTKLVVLKFVNLCGCSLTGPFWLQIPVWGTRIVYWLAVEYRYLATAAATLPRRQAVEPPLQEQKHTGNSQQEVHLRHYWRGLRCWVSVKCFLF